MSIHAQLSPEAAAKLRAQKRNSTISSLMISLLVLVFLGLLLFLWAIPMLDLTQPDIVSYRATSNQDDSIETKEVNTAIQRKPAAPSSSMAKVIAANTASPTAIPVPDVDVPVPSSDFGSGDDFGAGWGTAADSGGGGFGNIPADMRKRCSPEDRKQRLDENGGNQACEDAVMAALRYLKKNQDSDGSWGTSSPVAMTGLSILAYLGHCETPLSAEFGDTVTKGITFLVNNNRQQGGKSSSDLRDKHWCYEHAIAMYALAESYTFCQQLGVEDSIPGLRVSVEEGIQWILDNQTRDGGWDYHYNLDDRPGDTSIVAWHMQALKAAKATGLDFSLIGRAINDGLAFLERTQSDEGGFGYTFDRRPVDAANGHFTLAGAGTLCFQQHKGAANSNARNGVDYIDENSTFSFSGGGANLYEHYYSSQAMINNGGDAWDKYNRMFRDELLSAQNEDGSFPLQGAMLRRQDIIYSTALATLMLEVYYRFLPGTGGE